MATLDPVINLGSQYRLEFEQEYSELRKRAVEVTNELAAKAQAYQKHVAGLQPLLNKQKEELVNTLQDQSPTGHLNKAHVMATFTWTGILLLGATLGGILGGTVLSPILNIFVSPSYAFITAFAVLPGTAFFFLQKYADQPKEDFLYRHSMLGFAILEGLVSGFVLSEKALSSAPPLAALTPLVIGIGAQLGASSVANDRTKLLATTVGGGLILHSALGIVLGASIPYALLTILYTAIGFIALQLYIKNMKNANASMHMHHLAYVCATIGCQLAVYGVFGGAPEQMAAAQTDA